MKIVSIKTNIKKTHTWDIEIPDQKNYLLEGGLVSHNSSVIQNSTNGIEPVRQLMSYKKSKMGILKQIVPYYATRRNYYTKAWDLKDNIGIINVSAVCQKFVDMGISTNTWYNYKNYPEGNIPLSVIMKDQVYAYKYGCKNLYYLNTPDGDGDTEREVGCESGACAI